MNQLFTCNYLMVILIIVTASTRITSAASSVIYPCNSSSSSNNQTNQTNQTWDKQLSRFFLQSASLTVPIFRSNTLQSAPCSEDIYKKYSPMAYLEQDNRNGPDEVHFNKVQDILRSIDGFRMVVADPTNTTLQLQVFIDPVVKDMYDEWISATKITTELFPGRKLEELMCYRESEHLECFHRKCRCPQSGTFKRLKYHTRPGRFLDRWTQKEIPNTLQCVSSISGYCIRNSRSCANGGRCVSFGAVRPWPYMCTTGICRGKASPEDFKSGSCNSFAKTVININMFCVLVYHLLNLL